MPPERINPYYEGLIESIKTTSSLIQDLNKDLKSSEISQATIKARLDKVDKEVEGLIKTVRDGNGTKSIITRLALIEDDLGELNKRDEEFRKFIYSKIDEVSEAFNLIKIEEGKKKALSNNKEAYNRAKILNLLKVTPGIVALITILIQMFIK